MTHIIFTVELQPPLKGCIVVRHLSSYVSFFLISVSLSRPSMAKEEETFTMTEKTVEQNGTIR